MLGKVVVFLMVVGLTQATFLGRMFRGEDSKESDGQDPMVETRSEGGDGEQQGGEGQTWVMTPDMLAKGIEESQNSIVGFRKKIDELVKKLNKNGKTNKGLLEIMKDIGLFMDEGKKKYERDLYGLSILVHKMFENEHGFREEKRCNSLLNIKDNVDKDEFVPTIKAALENDLLCFDTMIRQLLLTGVSPDYIPSDGEVIDMIAYATTVLFRLKNNGERFKNAIDDVRKNTNEFGSREVLLEKLIRALKPNTKE